MKKYLFFLVSLLYSVNSFSQIDAALNGIILPEPSSLLTSTEEIKVLIKNNGTSAISNFEVSYWIDGDTTTRVSEVVGFGINSGDSSYYTFTTLADFSSVKVYYVDAEVNFSNDTDISNDKLQSSTAKWVVYNGEYPYLADFSRLGYVSSIKIGTNYNYLSGYSFLGGSNGSASFSNYHEVGPVLALYDNEGGGSSQAFFTADLSAYDVVNDNLQLSLFTRTYYEGTSNIYVRGSEADPWLHLKSIPSGDANLSKLSVSEVLAANGQNFSSSFQISFKVEMINCCGTSLLLDNILIEFQKNFDIAMNKVVLPDPKFGMTSAEKIFVEVINQGKNNMDSTELNIHIDLPDDSIVNYQMIVPQELLPGDTLMLEIDTIFNFLKEGVYFVNAQILDVRDENDFNNTSSGRTLNYTVYRGELPLFEDYETTSYYNERYLGGNPEFPGLSFYATYPDDYINITSNTKKVRMVAKKGYSSHLIYTFDFSDYNVNADTLFLDFSYNYAANHAGELVIRGIDGDSSLLVLSDFNEDDISKDFKGINLTKVLGENGQNFSASTQVEFRIPVLTSGWSSYTLQIDNLHVYFKAENDISITNLIVPEPAVDLKSDTVYVELTNNGKVSESNFEIFLSAISANTSKIIKDSIKFEIFPGDTILFPLHIAFDETGDHYLTAYHGLQSDSIQRNDTLRAKTGPLSIYKSSLPYEVVFDKVSDITYPGNYISVDYEGFSFLGTQHSYLSYNKWKKVLKLINSSPDTTAKLVYSADLAELKNNIGAASFSVIYEASNDPFKLKYKGSPNEEWVELVVPKTGYGYRDTISVNLLDSLALYGQGIGDTIQIAFHLHESYSELDLVKFSLQIEPEHNLILQELLAKENKASLTNQENFSVVVSNAGNVMESNIPISIEVEGPFGSQLLHDTIQNNLNPGDTLLYQLATTADLSAVGEYNINAFLGMEPNYFKDTVSTQVYTLTRYRGLLPYAQSFDSTFILSGFSYKNENLHGFHFNSQNLTQANSVSFTNPDRKALHLDVASGTGDRVPLILTIDLDTANITNFVLAYEYRDVYGKGNLYLRGQEDQAWIKIPQNATPDFETSIINLTEILASNGQMLSEFTQIGFGTDQSTASFQIDNLKIGHGISKREGAVIADVDNKLFVGLGRKDTTFYQDFYQMDKETGIISSIPNFPGGKRSEASVFVLNNKVYLGLGHDQASVYYNDFYELDTDSLKWNQISNFPGVARTNASSFQINNIGYAGAGLASSGEQADFYAYDPLSDAWSSITSIPEARQGAGGIDFNQKGYVLGGYNTLSDTLLYKDIYEYDPAGNDWVIKKDNITGLNHDAFVFSLNHIYVAYGSDTTVIGYNPTTNTVTELNDYLNLGIKIKDGISITGADSANLMLGYSLLTDTYFNQAVFIIPNAAPYDLTISSDSVMENSVNAYVGKFTAYDEDVNDEHTYHIVSDTISYDNNYFEISGDSLYTIHGPDYETKEYYSVLIEVRDGRNAYRELVNIRIFDENESPYGLTLSYDSITENSPINTEIGLLLGLDEDAVDSLYYEFTAGDGINDVDNHLFSIDGDKLLTNVVPDYEKNQSYYINIKVIDQHGLEFVQPLVIHVKDIDDVFRARSGGIGEAIGAYGYIGLGEGDSGQFNDLFRYDPSTKEFFKLADFPGLARRDAVSFVLNGLLYVGLGTDGYPTYNYFNDFYVFDPVSNSWSQIADFSGSGRGDAVSFTIGNYAYVGTGQDDVDETTDFYKYDPSINSWTQVAGIQGKRDNAMAFSLNGKGYITGGIYSDGAPDYITNFYSDVREYDPQTDTWKEKVFADYYLNMYGAAAFVLHGKAYITYGNQKWMVSYDAASNDVTSLGDHFNLSSSLRDPVTFVIGDKAYLATGYLNSQRTDTVMVFEAPNNLPTDISLSSNLIEENQTSKTMIGILSTTDPDSYDLHEYYFDSNASNYDETINKFSISNDSLFAIQAFNFEAQSSYLITITADDSRGGQFSKEFQIDILNKDDAPTDIVLNGATSVDENVPTGTYIGEILIVDEDGSDSYTYMLFTNDYAPNSFTFKLEGNKLYSNREINYEDNDTLRIGIDVEDASKNYVMKYLSIAVNDMNEKPYGITFNLYNSINENEEPEVFVGNFNTLDEDTLETFTYSLNEILNYDYFQVREDSLFLQKVVDFNVTEELQINVRTIDKIGSYYDSTFTFSVIDVQEAPQDILIDNNIVKEATEIGTVVGILTVEDEDEGEVYSFELTEGMGDDHNGLYAIDGDKLITNGEISYNEAGHKVHITAYGDNQQIIAKRLDLVIDKLTSIRDGEVKIVVYPNPTTGMLFFTKKYESIQVFDEKGTMILQTKNQEVDLRKFSSGVYTLKIKIYGEYITRKIIKN